MPNWAFPQILTSDQLALSSILLFGIVAVMVVNAVWLDKTITAACGAWVAYAFVVFVTVWRVDDTLKSYLMAGLSCVLAAFIVVLRVVEYIDLMEGEDNTHGAQ